MSELHISPALRNRLVALNLTNNQFVELQGFTNVVMPQLVRSADLGFACMPLYLREIVLCNNNLTTVPNFGEARHTLLVLDLSNNANLCLSDPKSEEQLRALTRLRSLRLQSCGLTRVCRREPARNEQLTPLRCCLSSRTATLEYLDLSGNQIQEMEEITGLACLKRLVSLNLAGNPVEQVQEYSECVRKICLKLSTLKKFNNCTYTHGMQALQFTDLVSKSDLGMSNQAGDDASSCSCVEGNPCLVSYNCKNWSNRYDISKVHGWKGF